MAGIVAHRPQAKHPCRMIWAAAPAFTSAGLEVASKRRSMALSTRFRQRTTALGVDFFASTTDASAKFVAELSGRDGAGKSITTAPDFTTSTRPPKTRLTLIGMSRSPVGSDSDMANANGQGILNGPLSSSAKACTTAMASEVSAASRDPGSNVSISALAASIWQSIDMAYASRSLRSSKSVYAPTTMPRAIFAAAGTRGGFELFMASVYGAGSMSLNGAKVALTLRQPVQTVSGRYAAPALGFAA